MDNTCIPRALFGSAMDELRALIEERSAVHFGPSRERFFSTQVSRYLSECGASSADALLARIRNSPIEYERFLESLLTQETSFFRYPGVFQSLRDIVLPSVQTRKKWRNPRTLRIWSAGCSTGEEPYSLAMTVLDVLPFPDAWEIEILATDISREALRRAERGVYSGRSLDGVKPEQLQAYFTSDGRKYEVKPRLRKVISFAHMNLAQAVYVGRMDCILCMNVLMYFSEERRRHLLQHFYDSLEPGGYFFLGHAESLKQSSVAFESAVHGDCQYYIKPGECCETSKPVGSGNRP